jgi:P27 family predicted phage terminase small subunit
MSGGRPPKPTRIKELTGNPGKRALNKDEPQFTADGLTCPRWLNAEARKEWGRVVKLLKAQRVVTAADRGALAAYCVSYARWQEAESALNEGGLTQDIPVLDRHGEVVGSKTVARKEITIGQQYQRLMVTAASRLGLDPSSRSKVSVVKEKSENPILELLSGRNTQTGS